MTPGDEERYSRQILFPPIGRSGQERIRKASICIVGCGALGSFQAEALARAGIGRLRLIDRDYVDHTNLQRQWLYDEADAREESPKAVAAQRRLLRVNHQVQTDPIVADVTPSNAEELLTGFDLIMDGADNFETRYLLNDISVKLRTPWVYGAAIGSYGITMPIDPARGPCFACVFPDPPQGPQATCDVNGILASTTAAVASLQVTAALRLLVGWPDFQCRIHTLDVWQGTTKTVEAGTRDQQCPTCSQQIFKYLEGRRRVPVSMCGRDSVQLHDTTRPLNLQELAARLRPLGEVRVNDFALRFTLPAFHLTLFPDGRAIVKGTTDIGIARSVYSRYVGQ